MWFRLGRRGRRAGLPAELLLRLADPHADHHIGFGRQIPKGLLGVVAALVWAGASCDVVIAAADQAPLPIEGKVETDNQRDAFDMVVVVVQFLATLAAITGLFLLRGQVKAAERQILAAKEQITGTRDDNNAQRSLSFQEQ